MELERVEILNRIDRLTGDPSADHAQELRELKSEYNRIAISGYNNSTTVFRDILNVFPPEVWIQIIKDSLPSSGYAPALLLLTMVSCKWRDSLVSIPTFWAYVEIRGSAEDSLATIETFTHLSSEVPIHLSIYPPPRHDDAFMNTTLATIGPRLREVTIRGDSREVDDSSADVLSMFELFLRAIKHIPNVAHIYLEHESTVPMYSRDVAAVLRAASLPATLRGIHGWSFGWRDTQAMQLHTVHLEEIDSCLPIENVLTSQVHFQGLRSLNIISEVDTKSIEGDDVIGAAVHSLCNLTRFSYKSAYRNSVITILHSIAPQLLELDIRIPLSKVDFIHPVLEAATRLELLSIHVDEWREQADHGTDGDDTLAESYADTTAGIAHLLHLKLKISVLDAYVPFGLKLENSKTVQGLLWTIFVQYKHVERLELDISDSEILLPIAVGHISELPRLKILLVESTFESLYTRRIPVVPMLPLEELDTGSTSLIQTLRPPSVDFLKLVWGEHCDEPGVLDDIDVRKLCIKTGDWAGTIQFSPNCFPNLKQLTVSLEFQNSLDSRSRFKLKSFPFLTTVTLATDEYTEQPTDLCFTLLYHPDTCPSLHEIRFPSYPPDWDVLLTMLERRNFITNKAVSRIRRITLPFIANHLRKPLSALLRGLFTERPANEELILGGDYRAPLDERLPGCFLCLTNSLVNCGEPVEKGKEMARSFEEYSLYSESAKIAAAICWTTPPPDAGEAVLTWVTRRELVFRDFLSGLDRWGETYRRVLSCGGLDVDRRNGTVVEITEHNI